MEDDKETAKLKSMMEVIPDEEEVAVNAIPLATKPPSIVDWKIIKDGKIGYYQIIRADGNSKRYSSMIQMLKSFDREDLETLWKLVKAKHGYTRPKEGYERGRIVGIKSLLEVIAVKLVLLVQKLLLLVLKVNVAEARMLTREMTKELSVALAHECLFVDFLFEEEPRKVFEALKHPGWVDVMQEELNQFARNKVWTLVLPPYEKTIIGSKQEEGINYDKTFTPVARLEAIRIFLAFSTYMNFIIYQIDVKSAFLNGKLKEKVYVQQPPGFETSEFPNHVCKLDKALYGLKHAPRACYET
ncbi:retrovirus-related pol polyprotein from transposon TNT 1-94 [Tanacetum coccineum]